MEGVSGSPAEQSGRELPAHRLRLLYVGIVALPMGIALQNCVWACCSLLMLMGLRSMPQELRVKRWQQLTRQAGGSLGCAWLLVLWLVLASSMNPANSLTIWGAVPFGYLAWLLVPPLYYMHVGYLHSFEWQRVGQVLAATVLLWGLISLSQYWGGWRIVGLALRPDLHRPRGFYSHPLSLAYAAVLIWPLAVEWLRRQRRSGPAWSLLLGAGLLILLTQSRTVQLVAGLLLVVRLLIPMRGRRLLLATAGLLLALTLLKATGFTQKYEDSFSPAGFDRFSSYPDDRLAFWHAHWLMIKERPIIGHGFGLHTAYRRPYYEQLGLGSFKKKYEAHNQYLQISAEGGAIGLLLFLAWIACLLAENRRLAPGSLARVSIGSCLGAFFVACLTQNGFHDASVRSGILLLWSAMQLVKRQTPS